MYYLTFIAFSLIMSMVPFSVALSSSVYRCIEWKEALKTAFVFAVFQVGMAAGGWAIGAGIEGWFFDAKVIVALILMAVIGSRYFLESMRKRRELRTMAAENNRIMFGFAFVISINTLLLSIGLGMLYTGILDFLWILALTVFIITIAGVRAGKLGWTNLGRVMEMAGGLALFGICIFILLQYLNLI
jgi:putative Mn2+ efflux pump MntP